MKKLIILISAFIVTGHCASSQDIEKHAPDGFDTARTGIAHGKINTLMKQCIIPFVGKSYHAET